MAFDFDRPIDRSCTASVKYDGRAAVFGTADVTPLWVADMDFAAPAEVTAALTARATHPVYGYTLHPDGVFEALIDWMAQRHRWHVEREWILLCPGVVPTLYAASQAYAAEGEGVIVQPPVYPPFFRAVTETGRRLVENPLGERDGSYGFDLEHLERCAAGARLLFLCTPHNPVGRVWREDELRAVLAIARRHNLVVLSDEIHADLVYPGERHLALGTLADAGDRVITAVAPSKTFNIPGLNLSALIVPDPDLRRAIEGVFRRGHVNPGNPFSLTAFEAAYRHGGPWLDALMHYLADSRDFVLDFVARRLPGIRAVKPEGTYLVWLDCRGLGLSDRELQDFFVREAKVGMNPGISFGANGSGFMRLNLGSPRGVIAAALERVAQALARRTA